ncbi:hypothetical protein MHU86_16674 [Fragilaria crotonensis]|nr:hypothetical protein MHU86_16674 [Fragilaria crotonensis]
MPVNIENSKFDRNFAIWIHKRFLIGLFFVKIECDMNRWCICQSRFKPRNASAISLFGSTSDFRLDVSS